MDEDSYSSDNSSSRQKRNKPSLGENCRSHRRKCINYDNSSCERCYKLELDCIYLITEKPAKTIKPSIPAAKRNKLFEAIWTLQQATDDIQIQLAQLKVKRAKITAAAQQEQHCTCIDPTKCNQHQVNLLPNQSASRWGVTITSDKKGIIHLESSIHTLSDLSKFVQEAYSFFNYQDTIEQQQLIDEAGNILLPIRMKTLKIEKVVRNLLGTVAAATIKSKKEVINDDELKIKATKLITANEERQQIKKDIIQHFFKCFGYVNPILIYNYHLPILLNEPDSLLSTSIISALLFSKCQHINLNKYKVPYTRDEFAESCRLETKYKLQEILFESEPTINTIISLWALCVSSIFALKGQEARIQSSLCWKMILELKGKYSKHSVEEELWKRLFYISRYLEFNFKVTHDDSKDFSNIQHQLDIDLPSPMKHLKEDQVSIYCFRFVAQLTINSAGSKLEEEILNLRLFAGVIDSINSTTIQYLENTLLYMWKSIPNDIKLGNGPFQFIDSTELEKCNNPCILRFNCVYYIYWMNLESRLMKSPNETNLIGTTFSRIDGDRALVIVSICADTATKLFLKLSSHFPCIIELHWLTMSIEILKLLSSSPNNTIKNRAKQNLESCLAVLKQQLALISPTAAPYLDKIKREITSYIVVNDT